MRVANMLSCCAASIALGVVSASTGVKAEVELCSSPPPHRVEESLNQGWSGGMVGEDGIRRGDTPMALMFLTGKPRDFVR